MARRTGRRRVLRSLGVLMVGVAAAAVTACAPITTEVPYSPSDGTRAALGDELTVENLLVLTEAEGDPALVVGAITNRNGEPSTVTLTFGDSTSSTVQVGANETVLLNPANPDGETLVFDASPAPPGASLPVTIATTASGSTTVQVPVLDGTIPPYDTYLAMIPESTSAQ